jgi:outer membrane protein OmpA-like peptidoglycan-associated protein
MNFLDVVKSQLSPSMVQTASSVIGADSSTTQKALSGALPAVVGGLINQSSTPSGASQLYSSISRPELDPDELQRSAGASPDGVRDLSQKGQGLLGSIFGGSHSGIVDLLGRFSGLGGTQTSGLLGLVAPLVMGLLGRHARQSSMDAGGLSRFLGSQKESVLQALPPGLSGIGSMLGLTPKAEPRVAEPVREADAVRGERVRYDEPRRVPTGPRPEVVRGREPVRSPLRAILPLALVALALWGGWSLLRTRHAGVESERTFNESPQGRTPQRAPRTVQHPGDLTLPDGSVLDAPVDSGTFKLAATLKSGAGALPQKFDLEGVTFDRGTATIDANGQQDVRRLATVLKAWPNAKVRIEGSSQGEGAPAADAKLSTGRAEAVRDALVADGVDTDRIQVKGLTTGQGNKTDVVLLSR